MQQTTNDGSRYNFADKRSPYAHTCDDRPGASCSACEWVIDKENCEHHVINDKGVYGVCADCSAWFPKLSVL